ncbi:arylsulfatase [Synoicihabitans lomoniglobus]|uniref:Arylsulfatase n=1 Tax=Synoicihabitans lomoniglobus TaxID=2909285 RepID=A0AAF0A087_9BACT|nr:arylsulfatase [Opitutaceae bacterium LMO-M01]WED64072.1 arylsulfatase [Opitutaceae bacterium LMO-M01]
MMFSPASRRFPFLIVLAYFALLVAASAATEGRSPNVVLILTDDQGWGDVGYNGNPSLRTPNLDRLARQSTSLDQFTTYPSCAPTRAGLLTGRHCYRTGVTEVLGGNFMMHADEITLAELMRDAGYATGIFGKWHLGPNYPLRPNDQGFQEVLVHKGGGIGQPAGPAGNTYYDPVLEHNGVSERTEGYCDDVFAEATIDFIRENADQPFLAYYSTPLPHFPLVVPDELADPYRKMGLHEHNALTYGMIASVDRNVGRIMDTLEELDLEEDTIVIFLSDNGPRTRRTKNDKYPDRYVGGLRGTKTSVYENGIRVPFLIRWPGKFAAGRKLETLTGHIDVMPTLAEACGFPLPTDRAIDGISMLPLLRGETDAWPDRRLFYQLHAGPEPFRYVHFAVRTDRYKLISPDDNPHVVYDPPSERRIKAMLNSLELYDLQEDPSEINNIAAQHPEIVDRLLEDYEAWFDDVTGQRDYSHQALTLLGTPAQPTTVLSRFDNRSWRLATEGSDWGDMHTVNGGHWDVRTPEPGTYRVKLDFEAKDADGVATIKFAGQAWTKPFRAGVKSLEFEAVDLPAATDSLRIFLKTGRYAESVAYAELQRVR